MSSWKPSHGLQRADAVVGEIEQAIGACENAPAGSGILRHRLTEIVAKAIDDAMNSGVVVAVNGMDRTLEAGEPVTRVVSSNGHYNIHRVDGSPAQGGDVLTAEGYRPLMPDGTVEAMAAVPATKKRGRPKGSTKKKAKAAKAETTTPSAE